MKSNKLKIGAIVSIVFNALGIFGYAALWFVLVLAVGLAKGFGGEGADVNGLDVVMNISMFLVPICIIALIMAIVLLVNINKNHSLCKKLAIILVSILSVKIVLNIVCAIIVLQKLSIVLGIVAVIDIICVVLMLLGIRKRKIEVPKNIESEKIEQVE